MKYVIKTSENNIRKKIVILNFILSVTILIYHSNCIRAMSYEYKDFFYYLSNIVTDFGFCAVPTFSHSQHSCFIEIFLYLNILRNSSVVLNLYAYHI